MKERIVSAAFSLAGVSLVLGALGFLSGIVQLFIDISATVSVRWLLLTVWIALSVLLVLLKAVYDLSTQKQPASPFEVPIQFLADSQIFVIRRNENFLNSIVVGCYLQKNGVDTLMCVGVVHLVQDKIIQIRAHGSIHGAASSELENSLSRVIIRPVVPIDALNQFAGAGD